MQQNHSYRNKFNLLVNDDLLSYESISARTKFEKEAKDMVYIRVESDISCLLHANSHSLNYRTVVYNNKWQLQCITSFVRSVLWYPKSPESCIQLGAHSFLHQVKVLKAGKIF